MVGGNILDQTRVLTTAITLEASKGDFAVALAVGLAVLLLALGVNLALSWSGARRGWLRNARGQSPATAEGAWSGPLPRTGRECICASW